MSSTALTSPVVLDGRVSDEKLNELLALQAEIYELQLRVGAQEERRLVKLAPGQVHDETVAIEPRSAAPLVGASTIRTHHQEAAARAVHA